MKRIDHNASGSLWNVHINRDLLRRRADNCDRAEPLKSIVAKIQVDGHARAKVSRHASLSNGAGEPVFALADLSDLDVRTQRRDGGAVHPLVEEVIELAVAGK